MRYQLRLDLPSQLGVVAGDDFVVTGGLIGKLVSPIMYCSCVVFFSCPKYEKMWLRGLCFVCIMVTDHLKQVLNE